MKDSLTVKARYEADVAPYVRAMKTASQETDKAAASADRLAGATQKAATLSSKAADRVATAQDRVRDAQDRAADAAGRLRVAQQKLKDARDGGTPTAIIAAEERLATAQRDVESTTRKAAAAQGVYEDAAQDASVAAGKLGGALDETADRADDATNRVKDNSAAMEQLGGAMMAAGGLLVGGFALSVKTAADFEKAMSSVKAATQETPENLARMAEAAKRAGADTAFSAEEAAGAIEEMAKAGVTTDDILRGGLDGALSLAAAGSMEVADAAELAASAMVQFQLEGKDLPHIADLLAAGAGKAQGSVKDLGDALNQSGLIAAQTGLDVEETTGTLAMFANAGLTGSDAGTSFKTMLQRLNPTTKEARELTEELGISAYDAQGNFIGMEAYAGKLQGALSGMSEQQRASTLNILFGSDAIRAASVLYEGGAEGVRKWTDAVDDAGYAAKVARDMQDNLAGDLEKLGGAFDTVFLKSGSGANAVLRDMTQGLEGFIDWIGALPESVLSFGGIAMGVLGGVTLLGGGIMTVLPKVKETRDAFNDLAPAGGKARTALTRVGKAASIAGIAFTVLAGIGEFISEDQVQSAESLEQALIRTAEAGEDASSVHLDEVFKDWATVAGESRVSVSDMAGAVGEIADPSLGQRINENLNFMNGWFNLPDDEVTAMKDRVHDLSDSMGTLATSGNTEMAAANFRQLTEEFEKHGVSAQDVFNQYPGYRDALLGMANDAGVALSEQDLLNWALTGTEPAAMAAAAAAEGAGGAMGGMAGEAGDAAGKTKDLVDELVETTGINPNGLNGMGEAMAILADESEEAGDKLEKVIDALFRSGMMHMSVQDAQASMYEATAALSEAVDKNGQTIDLATEAGRANIDALQGMATAGFDAAKAYAEAEESQGTIRDALVQTYDELVRGYEAMGQSSEAADTLAREMMGIPAGVDIETAMDQQARIIAESTGEAIDAIPGYKGVTIAVSEEGTAGSVQSKINEVNGKTEYVFVSDDGTTTTVQQKIYEIDGVERTVYVDDEGTVYGTQAEIDRIQGKTVDVEARALTSEAERDLNRTARDRTSTVYARWDPASWNSPPANNYVMRRNASGGVAGVPGLADGGLAALPGFSTGGVLPYTGLGTDMILGVTGSGMPIARVDDGEMVVRESSTRQYLPALQAINRDDPAVHFLKGFAGGGTVGREWSARATAPVVNVTAPAGSGIDYGALRDVVIAAAAAMPQPKLVYQDREVARMVKGATQFMNGE